MNLWMIVRFAVVVASAVSACFSPLKPLAKPPIGWETLIVIFFFIAFGLVFVLGIQRVNPMSAKIWHRPSWNLNPFNFREPIQFFHMGAYASVAAGSVTLLRLLGSSGTFYPEAFVPLVMGVGVLAGIQLSMLVFSSKMASAN